MPDKLLFWKRKPPAPVSTPVSTLGVTKFATHVPSAQNVVDIFRGRWASDLSNVLPVNISGETGLFNDPRADFPLVRFAGPLGTLEGQRILELGPLEGGHTYQLVRHGAQVVAVESNTEAFLKCLIVKELLALREANFLYGDAIKYLEACDQQFDLIFCCGVLYHMEDPIRLIRSMAQHTRRVFLWTHYYTSDALQYRAHFMPEPVVRDGENYTYYRRMNVDRDSERFWGGNAASACMLTRDDLGRAFRKYGLQHQLLHADEVNNPSGPAFSISFWSDDASSPPPPQ